MRYYPRKERKKEKQESGNSFKYISHLDGEISPKPTQPKTKSLSMLSTKAPGAVQSTVYINNYLI
jgi:hypothetical protein